MPAERNFNAIFDIALREIANRFPNKSDAIVFCRKLKDCKRDICNAYIAVRNDVKHTYMRNPNDPLDRHKCVSSFMIAFLENFQTKTEASIGLERVAISMGLHILKIFIREDCKDHNDMSLINLIERNGGFKFPKCECDDEPYIDNWALGLHYDRKRNRLSVLSLSNVLFLIEQHNRNLIY